MPKRASKRNEKSSDSPAGSPKQQPNTELSDTEGFGEDGLHDDYEEDEEEDEECIAEVLDDGAKKDESVASLSCLNSIWDSDMIEKVFDKSSPTWKCLHCMSIFSGHNATKCLYHVSCQKGMNIRPCKGTIASTYRRQYQDLMSKSRERKGHLISAKNHMNQRILDSQEEVAESIPTSKRQKVGGVSSGRHVQPSLEGYYSTTSSNHASQSSTTSARGPRSVTSASLTTESSLSKKVPRGRLQLKLGPNMPNPELKKNLDVAVADWIHSCNLPFYVAEDPKFKNMLLKARHSPANYVPPNRRAVGGVLLTANYNHVLESSISDLKKGAEIFGLTFYGDGATIQRNPKINLLCSGVHNPCAVLDIADCSGHMSRGGKKDAAYIARLFIPIMKMLDPQKLWGDLIYFDGASNVQKAGTIISKHFPRCTVLHGGEHIVSLYFNDIFKMHQFNMLIKFHAKVSE